MKLWNWRRRCWRRWPARRRPESLRVTYLTFLWRARVDGVWSGFFFLLVCYRPLTLYAQAGEQSEANKGLEPQRERLPGAGGRIIAARRPLTPPRSHACACGSTAHQASNHGRLEGHVRLDGAHARNAEFSQEHGFCGRGRAEAPDATALPRRPARHAALGHQRRGLAVPRVPEREFRAAHGVPPVWGTETV